MVLTYKDLSGTTWSLNNQGNLNSVVADGSRVFDYSYLSIGVNGRNGDPSNYIVQSTTANTQTITATSAQGFTLTRKAYIGKDFLRQTETFTNTGKTTKTLVISLADDTFDNFNRVIKTSSGDKAFTAGDDWYMGESDWTPDGKKLVHVVSGGLESPSSTNQDYDFATTTYTLTLAPGETKTLMHLYGLGVDQAAATSVANAMASMSSAYLAGMSSTDLSTLANFTQNVKTSATTTLKGHQVDLTFSGTAAVDGTGNARDNVITGNDAANTLSGLDGNDTLSGKGGNDHLLGGKGNDKLDGGLGDDTMEGGAGDDTYVVNAAGDVVTELAGEGTDTVQASVSYSIATAANVENLTLTGSAAISATGNANANKLTGNAANNSLIGGGGNDIFDGGAGIDTLDGGAGNDTYLVDTTTDTITDSGGTDQVNASVTFSLAALPGIENLVLTGSAAIDATGNALANKITGNASANVIDGGAGGDTMAGGAGNDAYVVSQASDKVVELAGEGIDSVQSSITHTLAANVENLQLTGSGSFSGVGNGLDNAMSGSSGNNTLFGLAGNDTLDGGDGIDTLDGGDGNDLYRVDTTTDTIIDSDGTDTVESAADFSLADLDSIENLILAGTGPMTGTGNALDNVIGANVGDSTIDGGDGIDTVSYASAGAGVTVGLVADAQVTGGSGTDTLAGIENLWGGGFADQLTGDGGNNVLDGKAGDDTLDAGAGDDQLVGGSGNDRLVDAAGDDAMNGGSGDDTYVVAGTSGTVTIEDMDGVDTIDASGATAGVAIDLSAGSSSNIDGRIVTLVGGTIDAPLDVVFLRDASNSYWDDGLSGKPNVPELAAALASVQQDNRFALASFTDKGEYVYRTELVMTGDQSALATAFGALKSTTPGDMADAQLEALMQAAVRTTELGFRDGSFRVAVMLTDSAYHVAGDTTYAANDGDAVLETEDYPTVALLKTKLLASGIVPIFAATAGKEQFYEALVQQLGFGTVVTLERDQTNLASVLEEGMARLSATWVENAVGGSGNDTLTGNAAANVLTGGLGNDTYVVQGAEDTVVELDGGGTDLVLSTGSFTLGANVEYLTLTGSANVNATGNAFNNRLVGNGGNNVIDGNGGDDRMTGGKGNDTYVVDSAGDVIVEYAAGGTDTVQVSLSYTLAANLENLTLTGNGAISGTGNAANNQITGNGRSNVLTGGAGNDKFVFNTAVGSTNIDTITDFVHGSDKIVLDKAIFTNVSSLYGTGALDSSNFQLGTTAADYWDRIIYNQSTGKLYYDKDGAGGAAAVQIALLGSKPVLDASDFVVI